MFQTCVIPRHYGKHQPLEPPPCWDTPIVALALLMFLSMHVAANSALFCVHPFFCPPKQWRKLHTTVHLHPNVFISFSQRSVGVRCVDSGRGKSFLVPSFFIHKLGPTVTLTCLFVCLFFPFKFRELMLVNKMLRLVSGIVCGPSIMTITLSLIFSTTFSFIHSLLFFLKGSHYAALTGLNSQIPGCLSLLLGLKLCA